MKTSLNSYGRKLESEIWMPSRAKAGVIIAHSYRNDYNEPVCSDAAQKFLKEEYAVLRFNFTGHGNSDGLLEDICYRTVAEDMSMAIDFMRSKINTKIGVYAISLGTSAVLLSSSKPDAQVLLSPPTDHQFLYIRYEEQIRKAMSQEQDYIELISASGRGRFRIGKEWLNEMIDSDLSFPEKYNEIAIPTLLIHSAGDTLLNYKDTLGLCEQNSRFDLMLVHHSDHNFSDPKEREIIINLAVEWMNQQLG